MINIIVELPSKTLNKELIKATLSTISYHNQNWFNKLYIERSSDPLEPSGVTTMEVGKMYSFVYDPKYADTLDFYDNMPISFIIGHKLSKAGNMNAMGINLSYIPPGSRAAILDKIVKIFNEMVIKPNEALIKAGRFNSLKHLPMYYDVCCKLLEGSGFKFAIRSYIYERIYNKPLILTYQDWWKPLTFTSRFIVKMQVRAIYYRYKRTIDDEYRIGKPNPAIKIKRTKTKDFKKYLKNRNKP